MRVQSVSVKGNNNYQSAGRIGFGIALKPKTEKVITSADKLLNSIKKEKPLLSLSVEKLIKKAARLKNRATFEFEKYYNSVSNPVTKNFTIKSDAEQEKICGILARRIKEVAKALENRRLQKVDNAELKNAADLQDAA